MLKKCIILVAVIFVVSVISGCLYAVSNPYESARVMQELSGELGWITDLDPILILFVIFLNNAIKSFLAIVLGTLVIVPIMFIMFNGYILGIVMSVRCSSDPAARHNRTSDDYLKRCSRNAYWNDGAAPDKRQDIH